MTPLLFTPHVIAVAAPGSAGSAVDVDEPAGANHPRVPFVDVP
jgi:hypothetical protein